MDFESGFTLWRELGLTASGGNISFSALTAIHYSHRIAAYLVLMALFGLSWVLRKNPSMRSSAHWLAGLAIWQLITGLSNVILDWPLIAALSHTAGAAALVLIMTWILSTTTVERTLTFSIQSNSKRNIKHKSGDFVEHPL